MDEKKEDGKTAQKVRKTVFQVVVLSPYDESPAEGSLKDTLAESDTGGWICNATVVHDDVVADDKVVEELVALGNDGRFFDLAD